MTKQEFFAGVFFELTDGYEYKYVEPYTGHGHGSLRRRLIGQIDWDYCGNIETVNDRGVHVFEYWLGKRISRSLFYNKLVKQPSTAIQKNHG